MEIAKDISVLYRAKEHHVRKPGGKLYTGFGIFLGDIPVFSINDKNSITSVVNNRGRAYAARKRQMYRKNKKKEYPKNEDI